MNKRSDIDKYIGLRIFNARREAKVSRIALASCLEISHQQLSKYETGRDRISAGKIPLIAEKLNKPVEFFFDGWKLAKIPS